MARTPHRSSHQNLAPLCEGCEGNGEIEVPLQMVGAHSPIEHYMLIQCPICSGTGRNDVRSR